MESPRPSIVFVPDIHGDRMALDDSLMYAGVARKERMGLSITDPAVKIVMTGDYIDRGPDSIGVIDRLLDIQTQIGDRLTMLVGNHELVFSLAMQSKSSEDVGYWVLHGGLPLLREVAARFRIPRLSSFEAVFPVPLKGERNKKDLQAKWQKKVASYKAEKVDFRAAFERAHALFSQEKYVSFFRDLHLIAQPHPSIVVAHASLPMEYVGRTPEEITEEYRKRYRDKILWQFMDKHVPGRAVLWDKREEKPLRQLLSKETAAALQSQGVAILLHGHDMSERGQTNIDCYGIRDMNGDVGMSQAYSSCPNTWASIVLNDDGSIVANASHTGRREFGRIEDGKYRAQTIS